MTKVDEIDVGFVIRANDEVKEYIKQHIHWNNEGDEDHHEFLKLTLL